ncbi:SAP30-binding protein-like [Phymastichus coffea]|uniref:SAP30-binding protein-like n=1 Tax=Phymastichus coffea TaxID=108790 RepID=UPI00273CB825|nr:SAP30-binding protein-like [Phymastichus coffea]
MSPSAEPEKADRSLALLLTAIARLGEREREKREKKWHDGVNTPRAFAGARSSPSAVRRPTTGLASRRIRQLSAERSGAMAGLDERSHEEATRTDDDDDDDGDDDDDDDDDDLIPPEPPGECHASLQRDVALLGDSVRRARVSDLAAFIMRRRSFRNPYYMDRFVRHCRINEYGSNYPRDRYDPRKWPRSSYYESLARRQEEACFQARCREYARSRTADADPPSRA